MSVQLAVLTVDDALRIFKSAEKGDGESEFAEKHYWDERSDDDFWSQITSFEIGKWAKTEVEIKDDYSSELNGAFLEAYLKINKELLRLYAFAKYGNDDNRNLTQEDYDYFQFRVKITSGSTKAEDNQYELLEKLGRLLIGKMSGNHAVITVLGLALIGGTAWGTSVYLEGRKEVKLAQIAKAGRKLELDAHEFTTKTVAQQHSEMLATMKSQNEIASRAADAALSFQKELLKAASKTGTTVIGDNHLTRDEAKALASKGRGKPQTKIIEQEMRVVGGNTGNDYQTAVIFEDPVSLQQYKINFQDPMISEINRKKVFEALETRNVLWVKLSIKEVDGDLRSAELVDVPDYHGGPTKRSPSRRKKLR